jgi:hypothetical protein
MDMFYIPALASFSGSLASIVTGWVTQRRKDRVRHSLRATSQREELYKSFIEEASRLYADALVNDKSEVSKTRRPLCPHRADENSFERLRNRSGGESR